jgi:hypothetical protein
MNRWLPLVKWLMAIPHILVLVVRIVALIFVGLAQLFIVLFTGRLNERMRTYAIDVHRYQFRVNSYISLMRDEYPPFAIR